MLAIPRVNVSYWDNLKPINVIIRSQTKCFSSTLEFYKNGETVFTNIEDILDCNNTSNDLFNIEMSKDNFEEAFQWNLNYLAERIKDCR